MIVYEEKYVFPVYFYDLIITETLSSDMKMRIIFLLNEALTNLG